MAKQTITRTVDLPLARAYVNALQSMMDKIHDEDPLDLDFEMWIGPEVQRVREEYAKMVAESAAIGEKLGLKTTLKLKIQAVRRKGLENE